MIAAWMLYALLVSAGLGLAALVMERAAQRAGCALRWTWVGAMATSLILPLASGAFVSGSGLGEAGQTGPLAVVTGVVRTLGVPPDAAALEWALLVGWAAGSVLLLLVLVVSAAELRLRRRSWTRRVLHGTPVFVTSETGPAVVGWFRPVIVLPRWVLGWDASRQRMMVTHEREHLRAGDPRLLACCLAVLALVPWNLALWWQLHRLRLAIEIDCDSRVMRGGGSPRAYASLLVEVAGMRAPRFRPVESLGSSCSGLERRIRLVVSPPRASRRALVAVGAGLLTVAALAVPAVEAAPELPDSSYLTWVARPAESRIESVEAHLEGGAGDGPPRSLKPPLPGEPSEAERIAAVRRYHPEVLADRLSANRALWFVVDEERRVLHTGVANGSDREIHARVAARHPDAVSDLLLGFEHRHPDGGLLRIVWIPRVPSVEAGL